MDLWKAFKASWTLPAFIALRPLSGERIVFWVVVLALVSLVQVATWMALRPLETETAFERLTGLGDVDSEAALDLEWTELVRRAGAINPGADFQTFLEPADGLLDPTHLGDDLPADDSSQIKEVFATDGSRLQEPLLEPPGAIQAALEKHPGSLTARYAAAVWEFKHGDPVRALIHFDELRQEIEGDPPLPPMPSEAARKYAVRRRIPQTRVRRIILLRFLSALAALKDGQAEKALVLLKTAIGNCNYIVGVAKEQESGNAARVKLEDLPGESAFTTISLYGALVVAYLEDAQYKDSLKRQNREFSRASDDVQPGELLARLLQAGLGREESQWAPQERRFDFSIPENLAWALSNLQRIRFYNGSNLPPEYLGIEAAFLLALLERHPVEGIASEEVALFANQRLREALGKSIARRSDRTASLQFSLLHVLAKTEQWLGPAFPGKPEGNALSGDPRLIVLHQVAPLLPRNGADLVATEEWRRRLPTSASEAFDDSAWPLLGAVGSSLDEQLDWFRRWKAVAVACFLSPTRKQLQRAAQESDLARMLEWLELGFWISGQSGSWRIALWESIDPSFKRQLGVWARARISMRALSLDLPVLCWLLSFLLAYLGARLLRWMYLVFCRYRILATSQFYKAATGAESPVGGPEEDRSEGPQPLPGGP